MRTLLAEISGLRQFAVAPKMERAVHDPTALGSGLKQLSDSEVLEALSRDRQLCDLAARARAREWQSAKKASAKERGKNEMEAPAKKPNNEKRRRREDPSDSSDDGPSKRRGEVHFLHFYST